MGIIAKMTPNTRGPDYEWKVLSPIPTTKQPYTSSKPLTKLLPQ